MSRLLFLAECIDSGGHRITVQRHIDERGDAPRRGGRRRGGEAFPVGARLVDVHMCVDEARQQHGRLGQPDLFSGQVMRVDRADRTDHAVGHPDSGRPDLTVDHRLGRPDNQIHYANLSLK